MNTPSRRCIEAGAALRRDLIARHPRMRQEEVARHYVSLAQGAINMRELIKRREYGTHSEELEGLIAHYESEIAHAHYEAFGAWPTWLVPQEAEQ